MCWSVSASGKPEETRMELSRQFSPPLLPSPQGLEDDGERKTVRLVWEMIEQCLGTFDPEKSVAVTASGHMGCDDWTHKTGKVQTVSISIQPKG
jgi:hypothetical protein